MRAGEEAELAIGGKDYILRTADVRIWTFEDDTAQITILEKPPQ
jgi:hypothetical protein